MRITAVLVGIVVLGLSQTTLAASDSTDSQKSEAQKGITVEDLVRGLKSAAKNIEQEIPKIGPAIVDTAKKLTDKEKQPEKQPLQPPASK